MIELKGKVRKWGRSLGVVIPKETIEKEGIRENQSIDLIIRKPNNVLRESYGLFKKKINTEKVMKEIDEELHYD